MAAKTWNLFFDLMTSCNKMTLDFSCGYASALLYNTFIFTFICLLWMSCVVCFLFWHVSYPNAILQRMDRWNEMNMYVCIENIGNEWVGGGGWGWDFIKCPAYLYVSICLLRHTSLKFTVRVCCWLDFLFKISTLCISVLPPYFRTMIHTGGNF